MSTRAPSTVILAASTLIAAIFVAIQAWYARVAFVEGSETRLLEKKLDICFENFDAAVLLDGELRALTPGQGSDESWPPVIEVMKKSDIAYLQNDVVAAINELESSLAKASILGPLDRFRAFLATHAEGLSQRLSMLSPARLGDETQDAELQSIVEQLSDFIGAQYPVFEGCRLVARGDA